MEYLITAEDLTMRILPWYSSRPTKEIKENVGNSVNPIQLPASSSLPILEGFVVAENRTCEAPFRSASSSSFRTLMDTVPEETTAYQMAC